MSEIINSLAIPAFFNLPGPWELILILVVVLIIFGPKKLPEIGKAVGQSIRELKKATNKEEKEEKSTE